VLLENILTEFKAGTPKDRILLGLMRLANKAKRGVSLVGKPFELIIDLTHIHDPRDYVNLDPGVKRSIFDTLKSIASDIQSGELTRKKIPVYASALMDYERDTRDAQTKYETEGF